ncbi:MAG: ATP-binding protein [Lautropia sp.]|nr:ATP-binding protein [Lautropia sp.]
MTTRSDLPSRQACCEAHGEYLSHRIFGRVWTKCPACTEAAREAAATRLAEQEEQEKLRHWQRRLAQAGIPERFQARSLDDFVVETPEQRRALAFARDYALGFAEVRETGRGAIFVGGPGTGKTHLAAAIGMHLLRQGLRVHFTTVMRAIRRVKDTWSPRTEMTESQAVALLTEPDLLILDEVGVQFGSDFERHLMFDVLNDRYARHRPTLLLSNLPIEEVKGHLGARLFDRLKEDDGEYIVFDWDSHRGRARAEVA